MAALVPGYVEYGFSWARGKLYGEIRTNVGEGKTKGVADGITDEVVGPVLWLWWSHAGEYAEPLLRVIEDIAFIAINTCLALKKKECRTNAAHAWKDLLKEFPKAIPLCVAFAYPPLFLVYLAVSFVRAVISFKQLHSILQSKIAKEEAKQEMFKSLHPTFFGVIKK